MALVTCSHVLYSNFTAFSFTLTFVQSSPKRASPATSSQAALKRSLTGAIPNPKSKSNATSWTHTLSPSLIPQLNGSGPNHDRQESSHPHQVGREADLNIRRGHEIVHRLQNISEPTIFNPRAFFDGNKNLFSVGGLKELHGNAAEVRRPCIHFPSRFFTQ